MAEATATSTSSAGRPAPVHTSNSFPRMDTASDPLSPRKRASTLQERGIPAVPEPKIIASSPELAGKKHITDVFENREDENEQHSTETDTAGAEILLPTSFDELPIEIKSLTERFLENLSAKVHPIPLTTEGLSGLFQDFYERVAAAIATHIASLSSRIGRDKSPASSTNSKSSVPKVGRARAGSGAKRTDGSPSSGGGEMLTPSEVADRRKARKLLELKRVALEEAVERVVCERVYDRIYKHRSTEDDARDEKLRSRTAALSLIGIGLNELHVDSTNQEVRKATEEKEEEIHHSLAPAREALQCMDDEHYPLGKLQHLVEAHKSIVETLSQLFPSSSSADEILPTLIYTLITSPPEGISVVSNLNFIQRFRAASKVDGEAAYCLVNLEAAISFLETVDLSSLRANELPEGPQKTDSSEPTTPPSDKATALPTKPLPSKAVKPGISPVTVESNDKSSSPTEATKALPSPKTPTSKDAPTTQQQRRISALVQAQADRIEAGRENFLSAADKIYESINGTLENSLQFVFGRFKDQTSDSSPLPKTLEDARKLVSSPRIGEEDDSLDVSGRSSPTLDDPLNTKSDSRMLELLGGRKQLRDRSADSTRSAGSGSGKRVAFAHEQAAKEKAKDDPPTPAGNLFATINPLNRLGVPSFARFARAGAHSPFSQGSPGTETPNKLSNIVESPVSTTTAARESEMPALEKQRSRESNTNDDDGLNAREALAELRKLKPPRKRFLEVQGAGELKIAEVEELLTEYRRLAKAIGEAIAS